MNERQQIFFIFVGKANLADSKFTCQRSNVTAKPVPKVPTASLSSSSFRERCLRLVKCQDCDATSYVAAGLGLSLFSRVFDSV